MQAKPFRGYFSVVTLFYGGSFIADIEATDINALHLVAGIKK